MAGKIVYFALFRPSSSMGGSKATKAALTSPILTFLITKYSLFVSLLWAGVSVDLRLNFCLFVLVKTAKFDLADSVTVLLFGFQHRHVCTYPVVWTFQCSPMQW